MQSQFTCPECGATGLTPEIQESRAIAVALRQLRLRCPSCSAIPEITEPLGNGIWKAGDSAQNRLEALMEEALKNELKRRATDLPPEQSDPPRR